MSRRVPLGRKEDFHLEFKGRDALGDPEKIAREVVAFLNADGGEVWVGLGEEDGRAVKVEPISDAEQAQRRLLDFLIETVEPSPSAKEVRVEVVDEGEGAVLRVGVQPDGGRGPYAFLRKGGRHFVLRIGERIRPMSREEVFKTQPSGDERLRQALGRVSSERSERQEERKEGLWLRLEPVMRMELDVQDHRFEEILSDPELTGNRRVGSTFVNSLFRPVPSPGKLVTSPHVRNRVEIRRDGGLVFEVPLMGLSWDGQQRIWPRTLCELPVSALRIAKAVYEGQDLRPDDLLVLDLAAISLEGWGLRPYTPLELDFIASDLQKFDFEDFLLDRPLVVPARDLFENPDAIGYRLVERVYEAFGLRREQMPRYFDPVTRRLVLPE